MSKTRILIVEDEIVIAECLRKNLVEMGYVVCSVALSGAEAITTAKKLRPDVILMDIKLNGQMDGIEAAKRIREYVDSPVIYLTAYADEEILQRAKATEPFGYLVKPHGDKELQASIEMALHKHHQVHQLREKKIWLTTMLQSIGYGLIATDPQCRITLMNPIAESLTGWKETEAIGCEISDIFVIKEAKTGKIVENPVSMALRMKKTIELHEEIVLRKKNGSELYVLDSASPTMDREGKCTGAVLVFQSKKVLGKSILSLSPEPIAKNKKRIDIQTKRIDDGSIIKTWQNHVSKQYSDIFRLIEKINLIIKNIGKCRTYNTK